MSDGQERAKAIFDKLIEMQSAEERESFLDRVCADSAELRDRVQGLLQAYEQAGSFLEQPAPEIEATIDTKAALDEPASRSDGPAIVTARRSGEGRGTVIGHFKLLQELGEGGMGTVYVAIQTEPVRRKVALKIIKPGMDSREVIARFEAERQALALMDHPNIARVFDAGTTETGRPYFVMELVKGVPITTYCDDNRLTPRERLELMVPVCQAIQHAHQKGIIHRDIKPSNVLIAPYDGRPVPKVIDFGIAKATGQMLTEKTMFTKVGQIVGTLEYMSPEQAELNQLDVDTRSDIYGLGVLLYELLTGTTPITKQQLREAGLSEMLRTIREEDPPKPSTRLSESADALPSISSVRRTEPVKLSKLMRGELDWIAMKALEKDRSRRYETANGLAADIQRYLNDEPVVACPPSAAYRFRKFARKNRMPFATAGIVALALITGTAVSIWQAHRANVQAARADAGFQREKALHAEAEDAREDAVAKQQLAEIAQKDAERARDKERRELYASDMRLAAQAYVDGRIEHMQELLVKHWPVGGEREDLRGFEWDYLAAAGNLHLRVYPANDYWPFGRVLTSPNRRWYVSTVWPRRMNVLENTPGVDGLIPRENLPVSSYMSDLAFSADDKLCAEGGFDGKIRIWDCSTWTKIPGELDGEALPEAEGVMSVAFSPQQNILATGGKGSPIILWDTADRTKRPTKLATLPVDGNIQDLSFAHDGKSLVAAISTKLVLCDVTSRSIAKTVSAHQLPITCITSAVTQNLFATGSEDGSVRLWNDKLTPTADLRGGGPITAIQFSWKDEFLAAATAKNNGVLVWGMKSLYEPTGHLPIYTIKGHSRVVTGITFHWDNPDVLWTCSEDGTHKLWSLITSEPHHTIRNVLPSTRLAYSADGRDVFLQGRGKLVRRWSVDERKMKPPVDGEQFDHVAFSDDGSLFAGTSDGNLQVWELGREGGKLLHQHTVKLQRNSRVAVTRDGRWLAWTTKRDTDFDIVIRNLRTEEQKHIAPSAFVKLDHRPDHEWPVFSPDGSRLLGQRHSATFVWDLADDPPGHRYQFNGWGAEYCGAFSPDGRTIAIGSDTYDLRIHDANSGDLLHVLQGHGGRVLAVAFLRHSSGDRLISGDEHGIVLIWDPKEGRLLGILGRHNDAVGAIACSPMGDSVASSSRDGVVKVWLAGRTRAERNLMPVRGDALIRDEMWAEAGSAYQQVLNSVPNVGPDTPLYWMTVATLLAQSGKKDAYRQHCQDLLTRADLHTLSMRYLEPILLACSLYPDLIGDDQLPTGKIVQALEGGPQRPDPYQTYGHSYALAALHRREAQEALDRLPEDYHRHEPFHPLIAAMAHYRLGNIEEARASLREATPIIELFLNRSRLTSRRHLQSWEKWLRADFLRRQLERLLNKTEVQSTG